MIWEKIERITSIDIENNILIVYGTNTISDNLRLNELLTHSELAYSERLKEEGQKDTWLSCRVSLRLILGSYLNMNPLNIELRKGNFGKLYLAESKMCFNISHSKTSFLLGFSLGARIGIDIEILDGSEELPSIVNYAFSDDEARYCLNGKQAKLFTEVWTLKEAFLKAVGVGLVDELKAITVVGNSKNDIERFKLYQNTFLCPNGETGSVVYRNNKPLKFFCLL